MSVDGDESRFARYAVDKHVEDLDEAVLACAAILKVLRPRIHRIFMDACTDWSDEKLTPGAVRAQERLLDLGRVQRLHDPSMGIELKASDEQHWALVEQYAAYSINVDLMSEQGHELGCLHDSGSSLTMDVTEAEARIVAAELRLVAPVVLLEIVHARRRTERASARRSLRARRRDHVRRLLHLGD